jgi:protein-disulfide isomerase
MSKQFWIVLAAIAVILGSILVVTKHDRQSAAPSGSSGQPTNHVEGKSSTGVTLVEYGDYQCPVCGNFYQVVKQVTAKYNDKIIFQFRNLPLTSIHQNAFGAARAAEAAGLQNKYWEMHAMLYANQTTWSQSRDAEPFFKAYATQLGLNVAQFEQDYASEKVNNAINADLTAFSKTHDDMATPTFYLDGKKLDNTKLIDTSGQPTLDAFSKLIDAEITQKTPAAK